MTATHDVRLSRLLSKVLRHQPASIGIELDHEGWVDIDVLLAALAKRNHRITEDQLAIMVRDNNKQRFVIRNGRIRANQGHSIPIELGLEPVTPPASLYHGTATRFLDAIRAGGLKKMSRQHVHLSADLDTAMNVGARHGTVVVLTVDSGAMHNADMPFFRSENGVWLTDHVPTAYLQFPG